MLSGDQAKAGLAVFVLAFGVAASGVLMAIYIKLRIRKFSKSPETSNVSDELALLLLVTIGMLISSAVLAFILTAQYNRSIGYHESYVTKTALWDMLVSAVDFYVTAGFGLVSAATISRLTKIRTFRVFLGGTVVAGALLIYPIKYTIPMLVSVPDEFVQLVIYKLNDTLTLPLDAAQWVSRAIHEPRSAWIYFVEFLESVKGNHFTLAEYYSKWVIAFTLIYAIGTLFSRSPRLD